LKTFLSLTSRYDITKSFTASKLCLSISRLTGLCLLSCAAKNLLGHASTLDLINSAGSLLPCQFFGSLRCDKLSFWFHDYSLRWGDGLC
jgi:hypothetical protein